MKIDIITFHNTLNFGATLQCAAFSECLSGLGHEVEVINYLPSYVLDKKSIFKEMKKVKKSAKKTKALIKGVAYALASAPIKRKDRKFLQFINKNLKLTKVYHSFNELKSNPPTADMFFCGSDQIWNPSLTGNALDKSFFLRFTDGKKAAYGASLGVADVESHKQEIKDYTEDYLGVSVREKSVSKVLSEIIGKDVEVVLDCTLLLEKDRYSKMEDDVRNVKKPYLLLYNVQSSKQSTEVARKVAAEKGLTIIDISPNPFVKNKGIEKRLDVGPGEFLSLVKHASYVVTNSFHGTVFSIIYEKPFLALAPSKRGGRILDLLDILELEDRLIHDKEEVFDAEINYDSVKELLCIYREKSIKYVVDTLKKAGL